MWFKGNKNSKENCKTMQEKENLISMPKVGDPFYILISPIYRNKKHLDIKFGSEPLS